MARPPLPLPLPLLLLLAAALAPALLPPARAGLLELLLLADDEEGSDQRDAAPLQPALGRNCSCAGPGCSCCMALDFAYIDLGGPGCVSMKYVSPVEGIALNISYGKSLLLSHSVKGARPEPACLDLLSDLAQLCARFSDLAPASDGLRWCLQLEPALLGDMQARYSLGCFRMGPRGMSLDPERNASALAPPPPPPPPATPESAEGGTPEETQEPALSEEELIAAVNQSAEEGIAFFSNLLGLTFGSGADNTTETEEDATELPTSSAEGASANDSTPEK